MHLSIDYLHTLHSRIPQEKRTLHLHCTFFTQERIFSQSSGFLAGTNCIYKIFNEVSNFTPWWGWEVKWIHVKSMLKSSEIRPYQTTKGGTAHCGMHSSIAKSNPQLLGAACQFITQWQSANFLATSFSNVKVMLKVWTLLTKDNMEIYQNPFPHNCLVNESPCILELYGSPFFSSWPQKDHGFGSSLQTWWLVLLGWSTEAADD